MIIIFYHVGVQLTDSTVSMIQIQLEKLDVEIFHKMDFGKEFEIVILWSFLISHWLKNCSLFSRMTEFRFAESKRCHVMDHHQSEERSSLIMNNKNNE